jgi:hypothetical protein
VERPDAATVAVYEAAIPDDPRAVRGQMFGHPCAFVNGNMFFGTFAQTVIARVGEAREAALAGAGEALIFEPMSGRAWKEYVQLHPAAQPEGALAAYAREALENTAGLPPKVKAAPKAKAAKKK